MILNVILPGHSLLLQSLSSLASPEQDPQLHFHFHMNEGQDLNNYNNEEEAMNRRGRLY